MDSIFQFYSHGRTIGLIKSCHENKKLADSKFQ